MSQAHQEFHDRANLLATDDRLADCAEVVRNCEAAKEEARRGVEQRAEALEQLKVTQRTQTERSVKAGQSLRAAWSTDLDEYLLNPTGISPAEFGARALSLRHIAEFETAVLSRAVQYTIPRAALDKLKAEVELAEATASLAEAKAVLLIARKLMLLRPVIEQEGSSLTLMGGVSDEAIASALFEREHAVKARRTLEDSEALFAKRQDELSVRV